MPCYKLFTITYSFSQHTRSIKYALLQSNFNSEETGILSMLFKVTQLVVSGKVIMGTLKVQSNFKYSSPWDQKDSQTLQERRNSNPKITKAILSNLGGILKKKKSILNKRKMVQLEIQVRNKYSMHITLLCGKHFTYLL